MDGYVNPGNIRVVVVDDQSLVRGGFAMILDAEPDIEVIGQAAEGTAAVRMCADLHPDVVLMDVRMPGMDGIEATRRITAGGNSHVLVLTTFDMDEYLYDSIRAGASGFLLKDAPSDQLAFAVRAVAAGDTFLASAVTRRLIEAFVSGPLPGRQPDLLAALTDRELQVLTEVGHGLSNAEIAARLYVSETTVKTHVVHILAKLGLRDRIRAVVLAYETGLVKRGGQGVPEAP
ncbi:response regulator [Pseudarthrobacter albicanus]|uniref:response regulator n=1 Tax=Pseudarthrobacter albicanus TaxID=2823873 RepID=UPI001BAADC53|nr:response regulator transcription factor [Pseudarthrobacter albicanus]